LTHQPYIVGTTLSTIFQHWDFVNEWWFSLLVMVLVAFTKLHYTKVS